MRISGVPGSSRRNLLILSSLNTALPDIAEPDTPMPLARIALCARSESTKDREVLLFLDGDHVAGLEDIELLRFRPLEGELDLLRVPLLVVDQFPADAQSSR
jgi:hypothetical protein